MQRNAATLARRDAYVKASPGQSRSENMHTIRSRACIAFVSIHGLILAPLFISDILDQLMKRGLFATLRLRIYFGYIHDLPYLEVLHPAPPYSSPGNGDRYRHRTARALTSPSATMSKFFNKLSDKVDSLSDHFEKLPGRLDRFKESVQCKK